MTRTCRGVNPAPVDRAQKSGFPARGTAAAVPAKFQCIVGADNFPAILQRHGDG